MTNKLHDPNLPAGAIVENLKNGRFLRNDDVTVQSIKKKPWFALMSVFGEKMNHEANKDIWNRWMCRHHSEKQRDEFASKHRFEKGPIAPWLKTDQQLLVKNLRRLGFEKDALENTNVIELSRSYFETPVCFDDFVFTMPFHIENSTFFGGASFKKTVFEKYLLADDIYSRRKFDCSAARFHGESRFFKSVFDGDVEFKYSVFCGDSYFARCFANRTLNFDGAVFHNHSRFGAIRLAKNASFRSAEFSGDAEFVSAHFEGTAAFNRALFGENAYFHGARFDGYGLFSQCKFRKSSDFSNGSFANRTLFLDTKFSSLVPRFFHREMHQDTSFTLEQNHWPAVTSKNAKESKDAYTRLRVIMNDLQPPDDEHFFFRQEMRCKAAMEGGLDRAFIKAYGAISDFGYSAVRPAAFLAGTVAIGWAAMGTYLKNWTDSTNAIAEGLGLSIANTFPFLGFIRRFHSDVFKASPNWLDVIAASQSVLGIIFLFFFLLGLRTRFRLK